MTKKQERVPGMRATAPNRQRRRHPEQLEDQPISRDDTEQEPAEPELPGKRGKKTAERWNQ